MKRPDISIYGTAHRPQNWMGLYKSIGENDVSFEIVFAGPNEPNYELPSNFRFIKSYTKPTQCIEIAARNARADFIMFMIDDCEFRTPRPLDRQYSTYKSYNTDNLIVSCKFMRGGIDLHKNQLYFNRNDSPPPIASLCELMSKKLYMEIGGRDRNFIAALSEQDIALRVLARGGKVVLGDVFVEELESKRGGSTLYADFGRHDEAILAELWMINKDKQCNYKDRRTNFKRSRQVESFSDYKILQHSQEPRGRWRGASPIIFEWPIDRIYLLKSLVRKVIKEKRYKRITNFRKYPQYIKRTILRLLFSR